MLITNTETDEAVAETFKDRKLPWMIKANELSFTGERIGVGNFGEVYKGEWRGQTVAIKRMLKQKIDDITLTEFKLQLKEIFLLRYTSFCYMAYFFSELRHPKWLILTILF